MLFQVPEFLICFLQVKVSSGFHGNPEGPQGCWTTEAAPAFVQRTVCLVLSPREPWYIQG